MRYNHFEAMLPERAFSPRAGRNNPLAHGMTLEGGVVKAVVSPVVNVAKGVYNKVITPVYDATLKKIPGVDSTLKKFDDTVNKAIPGGWGTVAAVGASFIPGATLAAAGMTKTGLATGIGALSGSGVMRKGGEFNLQGAIMGGAMAYGASQLSQGLQNAGSQSATEAVKSAAVEGGESALTGTGSAAATGSSALTPNANALSNIGTGAESAVGNYYVPTADQAFAPAAGSDFGIKNLASDSLGSLNPAATVPTGLGTSAAPSFLDSVASTGSGTLSNLADAGQGIKNLTGFGPQGISGISDAASAFAAPVTKTGMASLAVGASGLTAMQAQKDLLKQEFEEGKIAQAQYDAAVAEIDKSIEVARNAVANNPFKVDTDVSGSLSGSGEDKKDVYDTLYQATPASRETLYATGGEVFGSAGDALNSLGLGSMGPNMGNPNMGYPDNAGTPYGYAKGGEIPGYFGGGITKAISNMVSGIGSGGGSSSGGGFLRILRKLGAETQDPEQASINVGTEAVKNAPWLPNIDKREPVISVGIKSLRENPDNLSYNQGKSNFYKQFGFAGGGDVLGPDESYNAGGPLDNGFNVGAGGGPRFLSGGGDGMSDSIKAKINGTQEARLADGEFVIPADVVSHLGNGSSKAGAKQLYSMMDRARKARTGRKSQGKQINPRKYMPA
jgi:hypothetical protein